MKKIVFITAILFALPCFAQLKVAENGMIMVGNGTQETPLSKLSVGSKGDASYCIGVETDSVNPYGMIIRSLNTSASSPKNLALVTSNLSSTTTKTYSLYSTIQGRGSGDCIGLHSAISGSNFKRIAVAGNISNSGGSGAAVYGGISGNNVLSYPGLYAGYFKGDLLATGNVYGTFLTTYPSSGPIHSNNSQDGLSNVDDAQAQLLVDRLGSLPLMQYFVSYTDSEVPDDEELSTLHSDDVSDFEDLEDAGNNDIYIPVRKSKSNTRYALDIEQLKKNFPEFVYEDGNGNVSVDYVGMIPLLVQSVAALKAKVAELEADNEPVKAPVSSKSSTASLPKSESMQGISLGQNRPNPFDSSTEISVVVPETVKDACLIVCDMNGKLVKRIEIAERGSVKVRINAYELYEGMFFYSLVADDVIADTKKMIIM